MNDSVNDEILEVLKDIRTGQHTLLKEVTLLRELVAGELERQEKQREKKIAINKAIDEFYAERRQRAEN